MPHIHLRHQILDRLIAEEPKRASEHTESEALLTKADEATARFDSTLTGLMDAISHPRTLDEVAGVEEFMSRPRPPRPAKSRARASGARRGGPPSPAP